jgi:hypothetical protein
MNTMGTTIVGEMMRSSGTLAGQMTGMGLRSMAPSMNESSLCMAMMSIEMNSASPILGSLRYNGSFYKKLTKDDETRKIADIDSVSNSFDRACTRSVAPIMFLALQLFNEAYDEYEHEPVNSGYLL